MEVLDPRVEVLNFGVPGYNAEQIAARIEDTVPRYRPDLIVYLVNNNDVDAPIDVSEPVAASELLLRLRFLHQSVLTKPWRRQNRSSPDSYRFLARQLDRIASYAAERHTPLLLAFMRERTLAGSETYSTAATTRACEEHACPVRSLNVEDTLERFEPADDHLPREAYAALARTLCLEIAGGTDGRCVPPTWEPGTHVRVRHVLNVGG